MAECVPLDVICQGGNAVSGMLDDAIGNLAKSIMEGMSQMVTTLSTFWVSMPTANLASQDGVTPSPVVGFVNSELGYWTLALAVLSVILGGTRMIWEQRGAPLKDLLRSLLTLTLVSGLGLAVISILVIAADAFSASIIDRATDGKGFAHAMGILVMTNQAGVGVFILIILGLVGLIASLVQIVLMIVRGGMLVILAGILPTTAAFTNTEMGRQWFQKAVGWTIAFILYKPAAAVVYAVAFKLMDSSGGGNVLLGSITGFALMIVALLALPALMRFVTPMVGAVASGSGGGAGAAVGAMATGAVSMGRSGSGRGNASPTPASQPGQTGASAQGSKGTGGSNGGNGKPTPGSTGPGGTPGKGTTGSAATAGAGSSGSVAGAGAGTAGAGAASGAAKAAGPAGLAVAAGAQVASKASQAAQQAAQDSTGQSATPEGPRGSN
jgi:type IV secretion system protein TrbL